jgi:hypothetical protein
MRDWLLLPFRVFVPPILETTFSTIQIPAVRITFPLIMIPFFWTVGGFLLCIVEGSGFWVSSYRSDGTLDLSWVAAGDMTEQGVLEGVIASGLISLASISLVAAFYGITATRKQRKAPNYKHWVRFGFTFPIWVFFISRLFQLKSYGFVYAFRPTAAARPPFYE